MTIQCCKVTIMTEKIILGIIAQFRQMHKLITVILQ